LPRFGVACDIVQRSHIVYEIIILFDRLLVFIDEMNKSRPLKK